MGCTVAPARQPPVRGTNPIRLAVNDPDPQVPMSPLDDWAAPNCILSMPVMATRRTVVRALRAMGPSPWASDALLAVGVALTVSLFIVAHVDEGAKSDPTAFLWAVGLGALLLARRRYPVLVVVLSVVGVIAYYAIGYPPIGVAVPVAAATFSAAEQGHLRAAAVGSGSLITVSASYRLLIGQDPSYVIGFELPGHVLLLAAATALGDSLRVRAALERRNHQVAAFVADRLRREADDRLTSERMSLARDLHDSVGHALTVVSIHTQVAQQAAVRNPEELTAALEVIASTTDASLARLRATVSALRAERRPAPAGVGLADLPLAISAAEQAGISVETQLEIPAQVPAALEVAIFRIVQEAITNMVKHSLTRHAVIRVTTSERSIDLVVRDDGPARQEPNSREAPGHGLDGMRERAEALGGTLDAGPQGTGFHVTARFPRGAT